MVRFELYRNQAGEYQWRLVAANNFIVCWGEGYSSRQAALDSITWVKNWAYSAPVHDLA